MKRAGLTLVLFVAGAAHAGSMVECQKPNGDWYGAAWCFKGDVQVEPVHITPTWKQCIADMDAVIARERAIGREVGFVNAAALHEAARRKLDCQSNLARVAAANSAASAPVRRSATPPTR